MNTMSINKKPLKRSIFIGSSIFFIFLCLVLSILTYRTYTRSLYRAYEDNMADIVSYVESHIDIDDLAQCVETGVESQKFKDLTSFMDGIMEDFDVHFLYIINPISVDPPLMLNIISADTAQGRIEDPDGYYLDMILEEDYEPKDMQLYMDAIQNDGITYFKNFSIWGYDYTALKPLKDKNGNTFCALCVDVEVHELEKEIQTYTIVNILLIVILGFVFIFMFLFWMNRNITEPISMLEKSVVSFARISHDQMDPEKLDYHAPSIHTENEVESLSNAVEQMSKDMKNYVLNIIDAEDKVEDMKAQVNQMDELAYQDALTHVKNKAMYDNVKARVDDDIINGKAQFAILMLDLNELKKVNDTYGHEHGDQYIKGACHEICTVFSHSPVFRIGGDEFVVLLENGDFEKRDDLFKELTESFRRSSEDTTLDPWERYSAAMGIAVFNNEKDISMDDVFKRADTLMYQNKLESKKARE